VKRLSPSSFTPHETRIVSYILRNYKESGGARPQVPQRRISMDPDSGYGRFDDQPRPIAQAGIASQSADPGLAFDGHPFVQPPKKDSVFDFS
jgi:hypothetical protein